MRGFNQGVGFAAGCALVAVLAFLGLGVVMLKGCNDVGHGVAEDLREKNAATRAETARIKAEGERYERERENLEGGQGKPR